MRVALDQPAVAEAPAAALDAPLAARLHWILRLGAAFCFVGHGAFGIITKSAWLPFFALVGIGPDAAYVLMPLVGIMDIALGLALLWRPRPALLAYMVVWTLWTALLRPLTGMSWFEFFERGGNYGVPLAFLLLAGIPSGRGWLRPIGVVEPDAACLRRVEWALRVCVCALLVGHGGLALAEKPLLVSHLGWLGVTDLALFGGFELALGLSVLVLPLRPVLLFAFGWKVATELLFPLTGDWIWEFVERAGSYAGPLALVCVLSWKQLPEARRSAAAAASLGLLLVLAPSAGRAEGDPAGGAEIYIVRHAQTLANVTKVYSPENQRTFSPQGQREIRELDAKLEAIEPDLVVSSPLWRTMQTLAPYLRRTGRVAEIWPELEECCFQKPVDAPASKLIPRGDPIRIPGDLQDLFRFRPDEASRYFFNAQCFADSVHQTEVALGRLRERLDGPARRILVASHFMTSARLIAGLLGDESARQVAVATATLNVLRQGPDGRFELVLLNDAPFEGVY